MHEFLVTLDTAHKWIQWFYIFSVIFRLTASRFGCKSCLKNVLLLNLLGHSKNVHILLNLFQNCGRILFESNFKLLPRIHNLSAEGLWDFFLPCNPDNILRKQRKPWFVEIGEVWSRQITFFNSNKHLWTPHSCNFSLSATSIELLLEKK